MPITPGGPAVNNLDFLYTSTDPGSPVQSANLQKYNAHSKAKVAVSSNDLPESNEEVDCIRGVHFETVPTRLKHPWFVLVSVRKGR